MPLIRDTCVLGVVNSSDGRQAMLFTGESAGHDFVRGQFNFLCVTNIFIFILEQMLRLEYFMSKHFESKIVII